MGTSSRTSGRRALALVAAWGLAWTGCSGTDDSAAPPRTTATEHTATRGIVAVADEPTADELTPLLVSSLGAPVPFTGSDGRVHVVYELQVLNAGPRDATLREVATIGPDRAVLQQVAGDDLARRTIRVGEMSTDPAPATVVGAGRTAIVLLDDTYATRAAVPATFAHRLTATFAPPAPGSHPFASQYPDEVVAETGAMALGDAEPVVIGPPLAGRGWLAMNACCTLSSHRAAMMPLAGRLHATERYAIDFVQVNRELGPADIGQDHLPTFRGNPADNRSYLAYDQPLLAVADATVAAVVDGQTDAVPQALPEGLDLHELGGNHLVLDLGGGVFAFYAHVRNGSFTVAVGDRVTKGQEVGRLGNTGNSSEAHLHFHVSRGPVPLSATQWPYEFEAFDVNGTLGPDRLVVPSSADGLHTDAMPLALDVVDFPS